MNNYMLDKSKLLISLFLFAEANFFLMLIVAYVFYRSTGGVGFATTSGPTAASSLHVGKAGINTLLLLASSITLWRAGQSLKQESRWSFCWWLFVTIGLGALFLIGQGREWIGLINKQVTISGDLFGSTFFTLTGFHGLHVLMGLLALMILFGLTFVGSFSNRQAGAVEAISLYWHFVDVVWIIIFTLVYVWVIF